MNEVEHQHRLCYAQTWSTMPACVGRNVCPTPDARFTCSPMYGRLFTRRCTTKNTPGRSLSVRVDSPQDLNAFSSVFLCSLILKHLGAFAGSGGSATLLAKLLFSVRKMNTFVAIYLIHDRFSSIRRSSQCTRTHAIPPESASAPESTANRIISSTPHPSRWPAKMPKLLHLRDHRSISFHKI